jgi:hypothetical protein
MGGKRWRGAKAAESNTLVGCQMNSKPTGLEA